MQEKMKFEPLHGNKDFCGKEMMVQHQKSSIILKKDYIILAKLLLIKSLFYVHVKYGVCKPQR